MKVAVAGDWHVDAEWAVKMLTMIGEQYPEVERVLHVGDFGFYSDARGLAYLDAVNEVCQKYGLTLQVTEGNHEEFPFLRHAFAAVLSDGFLSCRQWPRIQVAPRGLRWEYAGFSFLSMGGANSINRGSLLPNMDWWAEEQISLADIYRTIEAGAVGPVDVMVTHDCPASVPLFFSEGERWPQRDMEYAQRSRESVEHAVSAINPRVLFHGHHHQYHDTAIPLLTGDGAPQRVIGLDMNGRSNNVAIFDLASFTYELP